MERNAARRALALALALAAAGCGGEPGARSGRPANEPRARPAEGPAPVTRAAEVAGAGIGRDPTPVNPGRYRLVPDGKGGLRVVELRALPPIPPGDAALPAPEPPEERPAEPPEKFKIIEVPPPK